MLKYKCASCGKVFYPEKDEVCPRCGDAAAPSVLTRIERKQAAQWLRSEGNHHYDEHCHDDDAWNRSYGADAHRAAVRSHEASLRANYAAHQPVDNPTQVSNANPAANPTRVSNANPADNPTRVSSANPAANPARVSTANPGAGNRSSGRYPTQAKPLRWIGILWLLYVLYRFFMAITE